VKSLNDTVWRDVTGCFLLTYAGDSIMSVSFATDTLEAARSVSAGCLATTTSVVSCTLIDIYNITSTPVTYIRRRYVKGLIQCCRTHYRDTFIV